MKLLVIPDVHAHPDYDHERLLWLGKYILDERPDKILCLGDFGDMPSLSSYDRGKRSFEGRRYSRDAQSVRDAQNVLFGPIFEHNDERRKQKKGSYRPELVMALGNHDGGRIERLTNLHPELDGAVGIADLGYHEMGWDVVPALQTVIVDGFAACHYHSTGISGRAISGDNVASSLLTKLRMSALVGHNHLQDQAIRTRPDGAKMLAISAGCYVHPDMGAREGWSVNTHHLWWYGVVVLDEVLDGYAERITFVSMESLRGAYR